MFISDLLQEGGALSIAGLIKEKYPAMRPRCGAGPRDAAAAADDRGRCRGVVRTFEGRAPFETAAGSLAPQGVDRRNLHGVLISQVREDPRKSFRQHRLARPGRPHHHQVVCSRRRDLDSKPGVCLPRNI
jgi:hypothetical protein